MSEYVADEMKPEFAEFEKADRAVREDQDDFDAWEKLITGKAAAGDISLATTQTEASITPADAGKVAAIPQGENLPPAPIDGTVDKWFFISGATV